MQLARVSELKAVTRLYAPSLTPMQLARVSELKAVVPEALPTSI